jgi:hypothetical protein
MKNNSDAYAGNEMCVLTGREDIPCKRFFLLEVGLIACIALTRLMDAQAG